MAPLFDIHVTVGTRKYTLRTASRTEALAQVKVEGYIRELQSRLAKEATLYVPNERGMLTEKHATASVTLTVKGRQNLLEANMALSKVDIVILAHIFKTPATPSDILARVRRERDIAAYSPAELAARIQRLSSRGLVELTREA